MMTIRGLAVAVATLLLAACSAGSGRSDAPTTEGAITNIVVGGTGPSGIVTGGDAVTFVMSVTNNGPSSATNFNVFDNVGSGLTVSSITCAGSGGAVCPGTVGVLTAVQSLPAGGTLTFTVIANVGQLVSGTVSNQLSVDVTTNPNHAADSFVATATVVTADLVVAVAPPSGPIPGGSGGAFTATVTNNGPAISQNVTITNTLSAGVTAAGSITCTGAGGAVCPGTLGSSMVVTSIPLNGVLTFTIPFTVNAGTNGAVTDKMTVSAATDPRAGNDSATATVNAQSPDVSVSETGAAQVGANTNAVFTAVVANVGASNATNVSVSYSMTAPFANVTPTVTCSGSAGAVCPATLGTLMTIPTLNAGRSVTFKFTIAVPPGTAGDGSIVNTVAASVGGDPTPANNRATFSSEIVDSNNGNYEAYAANGMKYLMTIDFDAGTYTLSGNGQTIQRTFTADSVNGGFTVSGNTKFRAVTNIIVGGENFGSGVIPYMAARVFGSNVTQLGGVFGGLYNLVTLNIPAGGGPAVTHAGTAKASGNVLAICQSDTQVYVPQNCPSAALHTYSLSVANNNYIGTDTISHQQYTFQLAIIGATVALVSAGPAPDGSDQLRIGLPDSSAFAGRVTQGASTNGDWITMTLTANSYAYTGTIDSDSAPLVPIIGPNSGPFAMLEGNRASDNALIYVMQSYPLSVAFGDFSGNASGLLQLTVP